MKTVSSLILSLVTLGAFPVSARCAEVVNVRTFGAIPNDNQDDTRAIQRALNYCAGKSNVILQFEPGVYDIAANSEHSRQALTLHGASRITLLGNGTSFRVNNWQSAFLIENCTDLEIRGFRLDWATLPFVQTRIKSISSNATSLVIVGGTAPTRQINSITTLFQYDEANQRLAKNGLDWSIGDVGAPVSLVAGNASAAELPVVLKTVNVGASLLIRYKTHGSNAFTIISTNNIKLTDVVVNSAPGDGAIFTDCENITISNFSIDVPSGSKRWISTNADALHFTLCRGTIDIADCTLEKMGDDAINIGTFIMIDRAGRSSREVILKHGGFNHQSIPPIRIGDILSFSDSTTPYVEAFRAVVTKSTGHQMQMEFSVSVDRDIPSSLMSGAVVRNESAKTTVHIARCSMGNNRARGFWLQTSNMLIEDSAVVGSSGPAVEIRSDVKNWWEGPGGSNINFVNCRFFNCNYGAAKNSGMICTYALDRKGAIVKSAVINNISFRRCEFDSDDVNIALASTGSIDVEGCNFLSKTGLPIVGTGPIKLTETNNKMNGPGIKLESPAGP